MEEMYDVIVVGAGNGGLAAAAVLARSGLKTLLVDQHNIPGGCATSFKRGRFEFEASLHECAGVAEKASEGDVSALFQSLGIDDIDWLHDPYLYRIKAGDNCDAKLPADEEGVIEEIESKVPGSAESVRAFYDLGRKAQKALAYLANGNPDMEVLATEHTDFLRLASHSLREVFDALEMPEKAQQLLSVYWPYLGVPTDQIDALYFSLMLLSYTDCQPAMPSMRSHELSLALEQCILKNGGVVWFNTPVKRIHMEDHKAAGVELMDGRVLRAKKVISNVHASVVLGTMIDPGDIPAPMKKLAHARKLGLSFVTMYLGLNKAQNELGIEDYSVFLAPDEDSRAIYNESKAINLDNMYTIVNCLNEVVPDASPDGTSMLFFTTLYIGDVWKDITPEEYRDHKLRIADALIDTYEKKMGIDIRPYIEEIDVASPVSFARYLRSPMGTPYGYELQLWDSLIPRTISSEKENLIPNLYFCGACGERGDGYSSTYMQGAGTAKRILDSLAAEKEEK